jgi:cytochrome c
MMRRRQPARAAGLLVLVVGLCGVLSHRLLAADGNAGDGAEVFKKCRACHDIGPTAKNKVGPLLTGILGRQAGSIEGFNYSDANRTAGAKGLVWTEDVMLKYLENPLSYMPGTKMAFAGLKDERDRLDVIAYLKTFAK